MAEQGLQNDDDMTPEQRMAWLREHGIEITTPEERKMSLVADALQEATLLDNQQRPAVSYVLVPADKSKPLQELSFVPPKLGERGIGFSDPLENHLKAAFSSKSDQVDLSLLQKQDGNHLLGSDGAPAKVSDKALKEVAAQGNVEVFKLVHPTVGNNYTGVNVYLDEVGMLKRLPLNSRASEYAFKAGYNPPPQFYGDIFLGRVQSKPCVRNLPFTVGEDTALDATWLQKATTENLEYQKKINQLTGRDETQAAIAGQDGKEKVEDGYTWTQTEEELEITIALPVEAVSKDIRVNFKPQTIQVDFQKKTKQVLKLFHAIDVDSGTWTLEKQSEKSKLIISVEKGEPAFWPRIED